MRAIVSSPDGPVLQDVEVPLPGPDEVLVKVRSSALNRADLAMVRGAAHGSTGGPGLPLGLEWAGEIIALGQNVTEWSVGDRVMATGGGAYAEFAIGHARRMYPIPPGTSFEQAATLPVALNTMHDALVTNGKLAPGQSVLIQGASSGVGLMAMQMARFLGAGLVLGSSTSATRRERLAEYGADLVIDSGDNEWVKQVHGATNGKGVDLIIDQLSGTYANGNLLATRIGGRIVNVGRLAGEKAEFNFDLHALRRIHYVGVTFRTRNAREVELIVEGVRHDLHEAVNNGTLRLPIDSTFSLADTPLALRRMAKNQHFGKIVINPST